MGLSSSKTTQKTNSTESGTQTPITPDWLTGAAHDYTDRIGAFGDMDPNSFVAPAAPLQQQAWDNAARLGDWQPQAATAAGMTQAAGQAGPNLAGAQGFMPQMESMKGPAHSSELPRPQNAFSGASGLVPGSGYTPAPQMPGYAQARPGTPIGVDRLSGAETATPASLLDNLPAYQNPFTNDVVNTSLAGFDNQTAQQRAQLEAQGARNGAFGGSRFGIAQGQFEGDSSRNRAAMEAQLRAQSFDTAAGLSQSDAAMRQQASMANAAAGNNMTQFNAGQRDTDLNRQLAAAGLLNQEAQDYGAGTRADLGAMENLGGDQRAIEQAYAMAGPAQLQMMGQLSGMTPYDILVGRNVTGNTTGTNTTTSSPSLFGQLLGAASLIPSSLFGGGGGAAGFKK